MLNGNWFKFNSFIQTYLYNNAIVVWDLKWKTEENEHYVVWRIRKWKIKITKKTTMYVVLNLKWKTEEIEGDLDDVFI